MKGARLFGLGIVFLTGMALFLSWKSPLARALNRPSPIFGLLVGTDFVDHARHSDTIVLARYDPAHRSLDLLSIPRDTRIDEPQLKVKKINEVYAYAFRLKNNHEYAVGELSKVLEKLLFLYRVGILNWKCISRKSLAQSHKRAAISAF